MTECPCGSKRDFSACCGPHIDGAPAPTAEALMRSRYSAYSLGDLGYIEKTCTGTAARAFNRVESERSLPGTEWLGLHVEETQGGRGIDTTGTVKFTFRYRQHRKEFSHTEVSSFRKIDGLWFYEESKITQSASSSNAQRVGRNDPCPCGSGNKFKKCCGAVI
jgi:SEC-C motif-containing protein